MVMILKQQIMADSWNYEFPISNIQANHIVDLVEELAIGFGEWLIEKEREHPNRIIRGKELLEIYKKENGL
jgi:hypothetical protein